MASLGGASGTLWAGNVRLRPLRAGTGPGSGQRERRLLFSPGSRTAGPGGAEAPFRPAGGARRLSPAARELQCRRLRSQCRPPTPTPCGAAARMLRPSAAACGAAAERRRGGAPAAQPTRDWAARWGGRGM